MKIRDAARQLQRHEIVNSPRNMHICRRIEKNSCATLKKLNDLERCVALQRVIYAYYFVFKLEFSCILNTIYCIWYGTHSSCQPRALISLNATFVSYQIGKRQKKNINSFNCDANNVFLLHTHCVVLWCVWLFACKLNATACINLPFVHNKHQNIKMLSLSHHIIKTETPRFLRINLVSLIPGFYFSQRGYSVWLGNARGNTFIIQIPLSTI